MAAKVEVGDTNLSPPSSYNVNIQIIYFEGNTEVFFDLQSCMNVWPMNSFQIRFASEIDQGRYMYLEWKHDYLVNVQDHIVVRIARTTEIAQYIERDSHGKCNKVENYFSKYIHDSVDFFYDTGNHIFYAQILVREPYVNAQIVNKCYTISQVGFSREYCTPQLGTFMIYADLTDKNYQDIVKINDEISVLNDDVAKLQSQIDTINGSIGRIQTDVATLFVDFNSLQEEVNGLNRDLTALENQVTAIQNDINRLDNDVDAVNTRIDGLNAELAQINGEITALQQEVINLQKEIDKLKPQSLPYWIMPPPASDPPFP